MGEKAIEFDPVKWSEGERQEFLQKGFRALRPEELPRVSALVRPADYEHDLRRGKVAFSAAWKNYSYVQVELPKGIVVEDCNFAQAVPDTEAIIAEGPITLRNCNLCNVRLGKDWTVEGCLTAQAWLVSTPEGESREFVCSHPSELTGKEIPPDNAVIEREL